MIPKYTGWEMYPLEDSHRNDGHVYVRWADVERYIPSPCEHGIDTYRDNCDICGWVLKGCQDDAALAALVVEIEHAIGERP